MREVSISPDIAAETEVPSQQPAAVWIKPEVAKLDLETAQQTV